MSTATDICPCRDDAQPHIVENGRCVMCLKPVGPKPIWAQGKSKLIQEMAEASGQKVINLPMSNEWPDYPYGTETECPENANGHEPDWSGVTTEGSDNFTIYVDVPCRFCGRSGCLGKLDKVPEKVNW